MSRAVITKSLLTAIANAIRAKTGGSGSMTPAQMATAIGNMPDANGKLNGFLEGSTANVETNASALAAYACYKRGSAQTPFSMTAHNLATVGGSAFENANLGDIDLSGPNGAGIALGGWVFGGAKIYGAVDICASDWDHAGSNTTWANISIQDTGSLRITFTESGDFWKGCSKSTLVAFSQTSKPDPVLGKQVIYAPNTHCIASGGLKNCTQLTSLDLPYITELSSEAIRGCTGITSINVPAATYIGDSSIRDCTGLTSVDLPVCADIGQSAFEDSSNITTIRIGVRPDIRKWAFCDCTSLTALILDLPADATLPNLRDVNAFENTPVASGTGYIYINDDLVDGLKAASNWSTYAAQIKPLSALPTA